jgi:hypothetical protein
MESILLVKQQITFKNLILENQRQNILVSFWITVHSVLFVCENSYAFKNERMYDSGIEYNN